MTEDTGRPRQEVGGLAYLSRDLVAGVTLAAYAIPVSLAYATLAGLPAQVGIIGYLLGCIGYAVAGSSRHLAIGPTSAISLMIAGTVGGMAGGDAEHYAQIASLAGFTVGALCLLSWLLRLSVLVKLISDSVLTGFKAGAGITIALTQLPGLLGTAGGGNSAPERLWILIGQLGQSNLATLGLGLVALVLLYLGERLLPGRPVALAVVIAAIVVVGLLNLTDLGVAVVGAIPAGLPRPQWPTLRIRDQEGIIPLAAGCVLLAYIEGVAAARSFADKHGYRLDTRREFLGLAAANIAVASFGGYPVAGGLSQTAVNEKAGARSRMSLVFASLTLAICLLFLTGYLHNLPKAVLAAVVLMAVRGLIDFPAMAHMWRVSRLDFFSALAAFAGVLLLGILNGILLAVLVSVLLLLAVASVPHVAFLGRIPGTRVYSDLERHPENEQPEGVLIFRPEASLIYLNADHVRERVTAQLPARDDQPRVTGSVHAVFCDLSASPRMDLAGARMLEELARDLAARGITMTIVGARGRVRDLLRAEGLPGKVAGLRSGLTLDEVITTFEGGDETG